MTPYTAFNPATDTLESLVSAITAANSHLSIVPGSIVLVSGTSSQEPSSVSFYDGSITNLGIGAGLLLTSGDSTPPLTNTETSYSEWLTPNATDADLAAAVLAGFASAGSVEDATTLQFQFTVDSAAVTGVQFDLIFGSDEYPEYSDSTFVDIAGVFVNGVNYALFGGQTDQPLSIISDNLLAGNFRDNALSVIGIEYDGVSTKLTIAAPVTQGTNIIKIAIGDTGDQAYDSGLFVSNLHGVNYSGTGLILPVTGTDGDETLAGSDFNEYLQGMGGNDTLYGGLGNDVIDGGDGNDLANFGGNKQGYTITKTNGVFYLSGPDGNDQLLNTESLHFDNQTLNLDKLVNDAGDLDILGAYFSMFDRAPESAGFEYWKNELGNYSSLGDMIDLWLTLDIVKANGYPGGQSLNDFLAAVYQNVFNKAPDDNGYWLNEMNNNGWSKGTLVQAMLEAAQSVAEGLPGKAYIDNKLAEATTLLELQNAYGQDMSMADLIALLGQVDEDSSTVDTVSDNAVVLLGGTYNVPGLSGETTFTDSWLL